MKDEYFPTPEWVTRALLAEHAPPDGVRVVDPCAGRGAITSVLLECDYFTIGVEINPQGELAWKNSFSRHGNAFSHAWHTYDWFEFLATHVRSGNPFGGAWSIVCNPPFSQALRFVQATLEARPDYAAFLLPLSFLASKSRQMFWSDEGEGRFLSGLYPLTPRPSFTPDGKTANADYAWFVWDSASLWRGVRSISHRSER